LLGLVNSIFYVPIEKNLWDLGQVTKVAMFVVCHVQSTIQDCWYSRRPRHQQRSVEELHCEDIGLVVISVGHYSPVARGVCLALIADTMHL
jgi:hypothetical protein